MTGLKRNNIRDIRRSEIPCKIKLSWPYFPGKYAIYTIIFYKYAMQSLEINWGGKFQDLTSYTHTETNLLIRIIPI